MKREKIERLIKIMTSNKIKFNKEFYSVIEHGFSDEASESLFIETVGDLEKILRHGVNSDFSKSMKDSVKILVDIAVKAGDNRRTTSSLEMLRYEKRTCLANVKMTKEFDAKYDMCGNVLEYVRSSKDGLDVLKSTLHSQTDTESANMKSCYKLLDKIAAALDNVIDIKSQRAGELYNEIMTKLNGWRTKLARSGGMCDITAVRTLEDVLKKIDEWSELCTVAIFKVVKIQDLYGVPVDDLTQTIEGVSIKQSLEMFLNHCNDYAKETAVNRNSAVSDKIVEMRSQSHKLEEEQKEVVRKFKAKLLDREDAEYELQLIKDKKEYIDFEIDRLKAERVSLDQLNIRREMIRKIETPIKQTYNFAKGNLIHIYTLFAGMDFTRLIGMLNNSVSTQEFAVGVEEMQKVLIAKGIMDEQGRVLMDNIRQQLSLIDQVNQENISMLDGVSGEKQESTSLLDALLAEDDDDAGEKEETEALRGIGDILR